MDPNAAPPDPVLSLLRSIADDVHALRADVELIREAVLGLGERVGRLERGRLTPLPLRAVSDSWLPDHGDNGR